jgi:membrane protease YdiL (CAAX protease family)
LALCKNLTLPALKAAARLPVYLVGTLLIGALLAPPLFWAAQSLALYQRLSWLGEFDFESFFHRALLIAALGLLWPLLRSLCIRRLHDLDLEPNRRWLGHVLIGFALSTVPLLCCGAALIGFHVFSLRPSITWFALAKIAAASIVVPAIEEIFFRGLILGILTQSRGKYVSIILTSTLYSVLHFLKAPARTSITVTWTSGFNSIAHSFSQFADPLLLTAAFVTLFFIGLVLADARLSTCSLWLPIGLHSGWIFANGVFGKLARREMVVLPWLGRNLLVGIVPLAIVCLTWGLMRGWLKYGLRQA